MKLFIWKNLAIVSDRYHSDGGLLVFASSLEEAKLMRIIRRTQSYCSLPGSPYNKPSDPWEHWDVSKAVEETAVITLLSDEESPSVKFNPEVNAGWRDRTFSIQIPIEEAPDFILDLGDQVSEKQVIAFPDSGCC